MSCEYIRKLVYSRKVANVVTAYAQWRIERGPSRLRLPPPLGDGLTPSLTVMLANAKF